MGHSYLRRPLKNQVVSEEIPDPDLYMVLRFENRTSLSVHSVHTSSILLFSYIPN